MPIISPIGRRELKIRILIWSLYAVLLGGAVVMIYPFLLLLAGSTKSGVDAADTSLIPRYLIDDQALYRKMAESFFNESALMMQSAWSPEITSFQKLAPPARLNPALCEAWSAFLADAHLPDYTFELSQFYAPVSRGAQPYYLRKFKSELQKEFTGNLAQLNSALGAEFADWNAFYLLPEIFLMRAQRPQSSPLYDKFRQFKQLQPLSARYYFSLEGFFKTAFLMTQYSRDIAVYNARHDANYANWEQIHLERRLPSTSKYTDAERKDWLTFARQLANLCWLRMDKQALPLYQDYLRCKYGDIAALNRQYQTDHTSFSEITTMTELLPANGLPLCDWEAFLVGWRDPESGRMFQLADDMIYFQTLDFMFRDALEARYGSLEALNKALNTAYTDLLEITPPQQAWQFLEFRKQRGAWRWEFTRRNYLAVLDYLLLRGRAFINTLIYCGAAMLLALLINPLAAYALSRYQPPSTYHVLFFLMLTMAFPPMVTQIPVFLMLRKLDLLNTFWALILPGMANGYSIFLLKGFFDSLPRELYDCAALDGAGELRIFWEITMRLSRPILAVIVLNAFTLAYSNFMMALLICQEPGMWTLMPWLYQLQQRSGPGIMFTALLIAAVPTFIVFSACQNVIMRGLVIPAEK